MSRPETPVTAVQIALHRRWRFSMPLIVLAVVTVLVLLVGLVAYGTALVLRFSGNSTPYFERPDDHFKYGSIGTEPEGGLPLWVWRALPLLFADQLDGKGFEKFGMIYDKTRPSVNRDLPVGVSSRMYVGIEVAWINCGFCHTGSYRLSEGGERTILPGMPANTVDMHGFIRFLFDAVVDERFSARHLIPAIEKAGAHLSWFDRLYYEYLVIPKVRDGLLLRRARFLPILEIQSLGGPGRVDSFNLLKTISLNITKRDMPPAEWVGMNDFPSTFLQRGRLVPISGKCTDPNDPNDLDCCPQAIAAHWDGNNACLRERNLSAATGAGVTPKSADHAAIKRAADWLLDLQPPENPNMSKIDTGRASRGRVMYERLCKDCHGLMDGKTFRFDGAKLGKVTPIDELYTDRSRLDAFSLKVVELQSELFKGTEFQFRHFEKTGGYVNLPLDGLWSRAPYLHNGSVPNLWSLLQPPDKRPPAFLRKSDVLDSASGGFVAPACSPKAGDVDRLCFDTTLPGNHNTGHVYGTTADPKAVAISDEDRRDLLEYLRTF